MKNEKILGGPESSVVSIRGTGK